MNDKNYNSPFLEWGNVVNICNKIHGHEKFRLTNNGAILHYNSRTMSYEHLCTTGASKAKFLKLFGY